MRPLEAIWRQPSDRSFTFKVKMSSQFLIYIYGYCFGWSGHWVASIWPLMAPKPFTHMEVAWPPWPLSSDYSWLCSKPFFTAKKLDSTLFWLERSLGGLNIASDGLKTFYPHGGCLASMAVELWLQLMVQQTIFHSKKTRFYTVLAGMVTGWPQYGLKT